jgi:hypothetical protein
MDQVLGEGGNFLVSQGLLGVAVFFLIWYIGRLRQEDKDKDKAHREEIAAKDKRIEELMEARLTDAKQFVGVAQEFKSQGQAFLAAIERKSQ